MACLDFFLFEPTLVLRPRKVINLFYWYLQIIFWLWKFDYHILQTTKLQRDIQGDELLTIIYIYVFPNIVTTTIFMFTGVNSPSVNFPSQKVFQVEELW